MNRNILKSKILENTLLIIALRQYTASLLQESKTVIVKESSIDNEV